MDLSILIPSRKEAFLEHTIRDILTHIEADTEVIVIMDEEDPAPPPVIDPRVTFIYHPSSIGQRGGTNEAARASRAKFIMKCDAHCAFDQGFDRKLMEEFEYDWTVVPRMYNLHVFNWKCNECDNETYQGPQPEKCEECGNTTFEQVMVWQPRRNRKSDFARFDNTMRFRYWGEFGHRPEGEPDIADLMCHVGACWMMHRERFWELGGCDEAHGSWGQMGVEVSCKTWLSGGRQVVNKRTWYAHMFRTQPGFGFPYNISGRQVNKAREYSRDLWMNDKWPQATRTLDWLLEHFRPVPTWHEKKAIVYYTDNRLDGDIMSTCQRQLEIAAGNIPIICVSVQPMDFGGERVVVEPHPDEKEEGRGYRTMFKQILAGLEATDADVVYFAEHDVLYHPDHFTFLPTKQNEYYYNQNVWKVRADDGHALFHYVNQTSGLCAYRQLLLNHYRERIKRLSEITDRNDLKRMVRRMGFEPGTHNRAERVDDHKHSTWMSDCPNVDIRHKRTLTPSRWSKDKFRNQRYTKGWKEAEEVPCWGRTEGRFSEFLSDIREK
jgi:hypothetical protein